jgi:hypothetical protein
MEVLAAAFDEDEALRNIQTQEVNSADILGESGEAVITEDAGIVDKNNNRGDEGVLEGVAVGNIDVYSDDSDEDEVRSLYFSFEQEVCIDRSRSESY